MWTIVNNFEHNQKPSYSCETLNTFDVYYQLIQSLFSKDN